MDAASWIQTAAAIVVPAAAILVAWGKIGKSQEAIGDDIRELKRTIDDIPKLYVNVQVDQQRQKWLDERDATTKELLGEIKSSLKDVNTEIAGLKRNGGGGGPAGRRK